MFTNIYTITLAAALLSGSAAAGPRNITEAMREYGWISVGCADPMFTAFVSFSCGKPDVIKMISSATAAVSKTKGREMLECLQQAFEVERLTCIAAEKPVETFLIQAHDNKGHKYWEFEYDVPQ